MHMTLYGLLGFIYYGYCVNMFPLSIIEWLKLDIDDSDSNEEIKVSPFLTREKRKKLRESQMGPVKKRKLFKEI